MPTKRVEHLFRPKVAKVRKELYKPERISDMIVSVRNGSLQNTVLSAEEVLKIDEDREIKMNPLIQSC